MTRPARPKATWMAAVLLLAAASVRAAEAPAPAPEPTPPSGRVETEDRDKDGRKETTIYYTGSTIRRVEVDKNGDGQMDQWVDFAAGKRSKGEADADYDGRVDSWYVYSRQGALRFAMKDTNGDGTPDDYKILVKGRELVLRELDTNHDGKIDKRRMMKWGMIRSIPGQPAIPGYVNILREEDLDFDGIIDNYRERTEKGEKPRPSRLGKPIKTEPTLPMAEEPEPAPATGQKASAPGGSSLDPSSGKRKPGEAAGGRWKSTAQLVDEMNERYELE